MAYDINNLPTSASKLANKLASKPSDSVVKKSVGLFTAAQATTAVQTHIKNQNSTAFNNIISNYQDIFNSISQAASEGDTSITISTTNFDYTYIQPLLVSYGYTVSELPSADFSPNDISLKYDVTISWPSSIPTPITAITPNSFIAIQGFPYSVTLVPQGGQGPYTFSLTGQLPSGFSAGAVKNVDNLTVQGTSTDLGGGSLIVTVTDSVSQSYTATVNWTVSQAAQIQTDWLAADGLGFIRNKPTTVYVGTTGLPFPGAAVPTALTGITSIDGNAETVTNGVYTTEEYADPEWITALAGAKITDSVAEADQLTTARLINGVSFDGSANITLDSLVKNTSTVTLNDGVLTFNSGQGASIDGAFGANNNGLQIRGSTANPNGPGIIHLLSDYNGLYNEITVNAGAIGIRAATSDGQGGSTTPSAGITLTNTLITVNGTTTMNGLVQFIGGTSGLTKSSVGLGNVTNESKATMFTDSALTGTTGIVTANVTTGNITTANITQGTLTTVNNTDTSLVNKQYVDSRAFFALAVGF